MNLASRDDAFLKTATPDNVGPSTYNIGECCKYGNKNLVPFLSSTIRMKPLRKTNACNFYESCDYLLPRIKYGNSMQYTSERKTIVVAKDYSDESKKVRPRNVKLTPSKKSSSKGKVAFCRVPFGHGYSAPSMPYKNSTGYDLDENNKLFKNPPEDIDTTVGPASYNVPQGELCFNSIRYAGCAWSKSKSKRNMTITNNNPGPTDYSPRDPKCVRYHADIQGKPLMRKCCNVPRYTCELSCKSKFQKSPAPGSYEIVDLSKVGKVKNLSLLRPQPFISSGKRFEYKMQEGPGPQTYQVCDCFKLKRDYHISDVPFKHTAIRLKPKIKDVTPAPGDYEITDPDYHRYEKDVKKPAFASTAQRKFFELANLDTPDPSHYDPPVSVKCTALQKGDRSYVFKSMVCRFGRYKEKTDLSAATYNIDEAFKFIIGNASQNKPNPVGFNSTEEMGKHIPDFAGKFAFYGKDTPGVGTYSINMDCSCESKGHCFKTSPRSDPAKNTRTPGPDYYQLHPSKIESLWEAKRTYNYRLLNNVIRRNPQMKGPKLGMRSSVKASRKKILRYFVKTGDFKHCW